MKFPALRNNHPNPLRCTQHICPDTMAPVSAYNVRISPSPAAVRPPECQCASGNSVYPTWPSLPYNWHLAEEGGKGGGEIEKKRRNMKNRK